VQRDRVRVVLDLLRGARGRAMSVRARFQSRLLVSVGWLRRVATRFVDRIFRRFTGRRRRVRQQQLPEPFQVCVGSAGTVRH